MSMNMRTTSYSPTSNNYDGAVQIDREKIFACRFWRERSANRSRLVHERRTTYAFVLGSFHVEQESRETSNYVEWSAPPMVGIIRRSSKFALVQRRFCGFTMMNSEMPMAVATDDQVIGQLLEQHCSGRRVVGQHLSSPKHQEPSTHSHGHETFVPFVAASGRYQAQQRQSFRLERLSCFHRALMLQQFEHSIILRITVQTHHINTHRPLI